MRVLGIDEAGRGCVLGALVVGAFVWEQPDQILVDMGVTDSKKISKKKRERIAKELLAFQCSATVEISPAQIDVGNLNELEEQAIIQLVTHFKPDVVIVDALGHPSALPKIVARLSASFSQDISWKMEPKADLNYAIVGAASIIAKTHRDAEITAIAEEHAIGSGYPSDAKTRTWLSDWAKTKQPWPSFVRTRWQTVRDLGQLRLL